MSTPTAPPAAEPTADGSDQGAAGTDQPAGAGGKAPRPDRPPRRSRSRSSTSSGRGGARPGAGRPKGQTVAARSKQLRDGLAELLSMPAIPFAMAGDEYCATHFTTQGPAFAEKLVELSERNPRLRMMIEQVVLGESMAVVLMAAFMYAAPPLIHHKLLPVPPAAAMMLGVPVGPQPGEQASAEEQAMARAAAAAGATVDPEAPYGRDPHGHPFAMPPGGGAGMFAGESPPS